MPRRYTLVTLSLACTVAFLIGLIIAGSMTPTPAGSAPRRPVLASSTTPTAVAMPSGSVNFADVAEQINPAVVNVDSSSRGEEERSRYRRPSRRSPHGLDQFDDPLPQRGSGSGFIIDSAGLILTNNHVIEDAERISVKLSDGRTVRAEVVGADPATDIALIRVNAGRLPAAPLGDSDGLRVGEWVCAIGNPLAYEHTVTVGVVSYIGRKLFDQSLDHYIQTDAAINFGNSGGPLINARGEVIGINSAISSRASNIGFAIPINQARLILPQLKTAGRVSRGYIGVTLKDLDPDLRQSLKLGPSSGALVLEVASGSPADRAGLRPYDLIVSVDEESVSSNDRLIREISARQPGAVTRLRVLRDGREQLLHVKLAERPSSEDHDEDEDARRLPPGPTPSRSVPGTAPLGLTVEPIGGEAARRLRIPDEINGVLVTGVEPLSPADESLFERGMVVMEINRQRVTSVRDFERAVRSFAPGDVVAFYLYLPRSGQRALKTIRTEPQ